MLIPTIIYITCVVLLIYTLIFGETKSHKNGPIGWLHNIITKKLWIWLSDLTLAVCGKTCHTKCTSICEYVCTERNPFMMIFYYSLIIGGYIIFMLKCWPHIPGPYLPAINLYIPHFFVGGVLLWHYYVTISDPGEITKQNFGYYAKLYDYDHLLYFPGRVESRTGLKRLPRAKYCGISKKYVARFDHFCPWVNTTVGARNLYSFLLFLFSTAALCLYCGYVGIAVLMGVIERHGLWDLTYTNKAGELVTMSLLQLLQVLLVNFSGVFALALFTSIVSVVLFAFALFHVSLIWYGVTTYETFKWNDLKTDIIPQLLTFKEPLDEDEQDYLSYKWISLIYKRLDSIGPVEKIVNIYNRGIKDNFYEVFFFESWAANRIKMSRKKKKN
mmetsp:Transcript_28685/g.31854  ORF Transcript_28685/g.31854 Transcript_28685/m.31854 type:complete len:386 (+) Transcript_28685:12-1169(+)